MDKIFLEEYPLFRKYKFKGQLSQHPDNWPVVSIHMNCPRCQSDQTFSMTNDYTEHGSRRRTDLKEQALDLRYLCQACGLFERRFLVHVGSDYQTIYKAGQYPAWDIKMDKNIETGLGKHAKNFKNGLVCESQSYGIGAFAYYRRIIEDIIDELLDSISDLIEPEHKTEYEAALAKTKTTRVAQDKIELVKDLLPAKLRPSGWNPLTLLHSQLSEGLHAQTDESCLEAAGDIRAILVYLIDVIVRNRESGKSFTASMKSLLDRRAGKKA